MNNAAEVSRCLHRLGGVYRDPTRVSRDASNLLNSPPGHHLRPQASSFVQNDGSSTPSLLVSGTVQMVYRGQTYNIPIDLYLPPNYPIQPPIIYVRPVSTMMIKEGHRHVGADGMVYMPYLHGWNAGSHDLVGACKEMSDIFGREPPVFSKPPGYVSGGGIQTGPDVSTTPSPSPSPAPFLPSYDDIRSRLRFPFGGGEPKMTEEERLAKEAEDANAAVAVARAADEREARDQQMAQEARQHLVAKSKQILEAYRIASIDEIQKGTTDQILLQRSHGFLNGTTDNRSDDDNDIGQIAYLDRRKAELEGHHDTLDSSISKLQSFIRSAEEEKSATTEISVDELAVPGDIHSAQMLVLSAENAAITDALFFLDKALADHRISMDHHLRAVRKLAKRQFLARAHLLKIGQVKASEAISTRSW